VATKPNAKKLILDLLLSAEGRPLSARNAILSCALFGIGDNNVRVALARLSAEGLIEAADRGQYQLSDKAHELADEVATWRSAEQRLRNWVGDYIAIHCGALGRSNRAALRRRDRALAMLGFRELDRGLYLRPNNIEADVEAVRQRLHRIGLEAAAAVFVAGNFDPERRAAIARLWDGKALNRSYRSQREKLEGWMARADRLDRETAARECFVIGGCAIRAVVFDPLLPEPMVDVAERHAFVETVRRFDRYGQVIWRALHESA
jgi:phenylacetic acid degradation operon negative regulatory protein